MAGQRDHDFRVDIHAVALDPHGRFQDGPNLHFGDLRHDDAQAVAAQAEHGIGFLQGLDPVEDVFLLAHLGQGLVDLTQGVKVLDADLQVGQVLHQVVIGGQELVQRRIEQADDDRQAVHGPEKAFEVAPLHGQQFFQGGDPAPSLVAMIISWTMGRRSSSKNMCSVRQRPMPSAP